MSGLVDGVKSMTAQQLEAQFRMVSMPWFSHFVSNDPRSVLRKVKSPVLAMIGENDPQAPYRENLDEIEARSRLAETPARRSPILRN